ncbi:pseudouridine synthase [Solimonas soli]|uniref:pseudouridine synthase n=1 Tax=Solimonas soli TaxID=413479 RepID=UPI0004B69A80|nr:pseudouridine synthase [Solimonas soli]
MSERIQKLLATAGVASRREIERLIEEGRILVNGRPAEAGQRVDHNDHIRVDGRAISLKRKADPARLLIYKKRVGELVTRDDPEGRRTVFRKLPRLESGRWIAVGRLDINTSGLLLFTNHGELARRLTHPSFEIPRTYAARVLGTVDEAVIARWTAGVELDDGMARFERVERSESEDGEGANQWFHVSVREGRNRLVRRLIESQGLQVSRLIRISYGPIELGRGNKSGTAREATAAELLAVLDAVGLTEAEAGLETRKSGPGGKPPARGAGRFVPPSRGPRFYDDDDDEEDDEDDEDERPRRAPRAARPASGGGRPSRDGAARKTRDDARGGKAQERSGARPPAAAAAGRREARADQGRGGRGAKGAARAAGAGGRGEGDARGGRSPARFAGAGEGRDAGGREGRATAARRGGDARPAARGERQLADRGKPAGARPARGAGPRPAGRKHPPRTRR